MSVFGEAIQAAIDRGGCRPGGRRDRRWRSLRGIGQSQTASALAVCLALNIAACFALAGCSIVSEQPPRVPFGMMLLTGFMLVLLGFVAGLAVCGGCR